LTSSTRLRPLIRMEERRIPVCCTQCAYQPEEELGRDCEVPSSILTIANLRCCRQRRVRLLTRAPESNMRKVTAALCLIIVQALLIAHAQEPGVVAIQPFRPKNVLVVDEAGAVKRAPEQLKLRLHSETLNAPEDVGSVLGRNGLSNDPKTLGMLKKLNPTQDFSKGALPMGTKLDVLVPRTGEEDFGKKFLVGKKVTFESPEIAKWAVHDELTRAARIKSTAYRLAPSAYERPESLAEHRKLVTDIDKAAKVVATKADSLSATDLAVAKYELQYASIRAEQFNDLAKRGSATDSDLAAFKEVAAPTQRMIPRVTSGQSPVPYRRVRVVVSKGESQEDAKELQVYVLPAGVLANPTKFSKEDIETYLSKFSFQEEASPASADIPVFDTRIWIGPRLKFPEMVRLIQSGAVSKVHPVADSDPLASFTVVRFRAPTDVVSP
jgi:hypothetical protein